MKKSDVKRESDIMREIQIAASKIGWRLFRNNVGVAYHKDGTRIRFGLCNGSCDLVGWDDTGRFVSVEVKTETGHPSPAQCRFINRVNVSGGFAFIARSVAEFLAHVDTLAQIG